MSSKNPQPTLSTIGLPAPADFASAPYEAIHGRVSAKKDDHSEPWTHYAGAWNAVAYRFISCAEHDEAFTESVRQHGNSPPPVHRYVQEKELFGFFVTGLAVLESFCYGAYAIAAIANPHGFPLSDPRAITPQTTAAGFSAAFPGDAITATLTSLNNALDFKQWKGFRNVLAHRATPGRQFMAGGAEDGLALWQNGITIDAITTASRRRWLAATLRGLVEAADAFTLSHL